MERKHKIISVIAFLLVCVVFSRVCISFIPTEAIAVMTFFCSVGLLMSDKWEFSKLFLVFIIYIFFNILLANPSHIFKPWLRYVLFINLLLIVSPFIQSPNCVRFRYQLLRYVIYACVLIALTSFVCYFVGFNNMQYKADVEYSDIGGTFGGITKHSIILGITSGIASCYLFYRYLTQKKFFWFLLSCVCFASVLFAASRGALYATIIAIVVEIMVAVKHRIINIVKAVGIPCIVAAAFLVVFPQTLSGINYKNTERGDSGGVFSSREVKIGYRIREFNSSPVVGVGFSSIDPYGGDEYDRWTGVVEPGSSWFAVLSMLGVIGAIFMVIILSKSIISIRKIKSSNLYLLYIGLLTYILFCSFSEGFIFAAGSPLCFMLWLIIGCAVDAQTYITDEIKDIKLGYYGQFS